MPLPFAFVFEPQHRPELRTALRSRRAWAVAGGLVIAASVGLALAHGFEPADDGHTAAALAITSVPTGAEIQVDGRSRGRTPTSLSLSAGEHRLTLRSDGYADATERIALQPGERGTLKSELWFRTAEVQRLLPPLPGAAIVGADFLADGRLALSLALPSSDERKLWLVDGGAAPRRIGPSDARVSLAVSADGASFAYLPRAMPADADAGRHEIWIAASDPRQGWRLFTLPSGEHLLDLGWAPNGQYLLVAARDQQPGGAQRTRLRRLAAAGAEPRELVELPSDVVVGSFAWSPDGQWAAFLTRVGQVTGLCLLDIAGGQLRYLGDLSRDESTPLPFPPLAWSLDGYRLVYAAPRQDPPNQGGWLFGPRPTPALFRAEADGGAAQPLAGGEGLTPTWANERQVVAVVRSDNRLLVRRFDERGDATDLSELPLKAGTGLALRWDLGHAQAVMAVRGGTGFETGRLDYWLVRFRREGDR
jgi:hypothetical protein